MGAIRWRDLLGPPSLVVSAALLITAIVPAAIAAGPLRPPPSPVSACPAPGVVGGGELAAVAALASVEASISTEALLTARGEQTGQRLAVGAGTGQPVAISLPAESFVAQPVGELLVYGSHNPGVGSEVRAVLLGSGCDVRLARPNHVVRSAVLDRAGRFLYVHAVIQEERRDAGVVRHDLATGETHQVVEPLPDSDHFGRTFGTLLHWSIAGDELAVQSCGFDLCRTRILDTASAAVQTYAGEGHGALVGFDRFGLVTYDVCHGAPCDVLAIERGSGAARVLVEEAFDAALVAQRGASLLIAETAAGPVEVAP